MVALSLVFVRSGTIRYSLIGSGKTKLRLPGLLRFRPCLLYDFYRLRSFCLRDASHTTVVCVHVFYGLDQRLLGLAGSIPPPGAAARTQVGVLFTAMMRITKSFFVKPSLMLLFFCVCKALFFDRGLKE